MATDSAPKRAARERIREQNRAAYHDLILEAAERVFNRRGYARTRMSDVATEAHVATGTLYKHFQSKDDVFNRLIALRSERFFTEIERLYRAASDPLERIAALVRFVFEHMQQHRAMYTILMELRGGAASSIESVRDDDVAHYYAKYVAVFERAFRAAVRSRRLRKSIAKPDVLAQALTGAINGVIRGWIADGSPRALARNADIILELFVGETRE